jgi:hypothetical protein
MKLLAECFAAAADAAPMLLSSALFLIGYGRVVLHLLPETSHFPIFPFFLLADE